MISPSPLKASAALLLVSALGARTALAMNAAELKIYGPIVEYQERELEWRSFASGKGPDREQGYALSAGYGLTPYWETELYEVLHKDSGGPLVADVIEWENRFQLAPQGRFWADPGLLVEMEFPQREDDPAELRVAPLLEKQIASTVLTLNLPFGWKFGRNYEPGTAFAYAARAEYLLKAYFSPALEAFGEPGTIGSFPLAAEQTHSLGPAFYGVARLGGKRKIRYSASSLFGLTPASSDWTVVTRLEFEF